MDPLADLLLLLGALSLFFIVLGLLAELLARLPVLVRGRTARLRHPRRKPGRRPGPWAGRRWLAPPVQAWRPAGAGVGDGRLRAPVRPHRPGLGPVDLPARQPLAAAPGPGPGHHSLISCDYCLFNEKYPIDRPK